MTLMEYAESVTDDSYFSDDMFIEILETQDAVTKARGLEAIRSACKKHKRAKEFDALFKAFISQYASIKRAEDSNVTDFTDSPFGALKCGKYKCDDMGVVANEITKNGDFYTTTVCPHPIVIQERYCNIDTDTEKAKIVFFKDGRWRSIVADMATIFNKTRISELASRGITVTSESAKDMVKYLADLVALNGEGIRLYKSTSRLGWIGSDFAPYAEDLKYDGDLDFQSMYDCVQEVGDYDVWLTHMYELRNFKEIRLMLATSFASPIIELVGALPFVLHLWGKTGFGKTVSLMIASSVWGNPDYGKLTRSMNMTSNAMTRTASFLYSIPFCADELQQIKDNWGGNYDNLIMKLCEGVDRGRAKARGGVEQLMTWRNSFIFTGEEPVTKSNSGGGVRNRCIEIEVKNQIIEDGNKTATIIKENYGHAGKQFIDYIKNKPKKDLLERYKAIFKDIMLQVDTTEKQAYSMALILLADELTCECIFKDDVPLDVAAVADFLHSAKSVDVAERAYALVLDWVQENLYKFDVEGGAASPSIQVWGRHNKDGNLYVIKSVLERFLKEAKIDFDQCKKDWKERGYLIANSQSRYYTQSTMNGVRNYFYILNVAGNGFDDAPLEDMPF